MLCTHLDMYTRQVEQVLLLFLPHMDVVRYLTEHVRAIPVYSSANYSNFFNNISQLLHNLGPFQCHM